MLHQPDMGAALVRKRSAMLHQEGLRQCMQRIRDVQESLTWHRIHWSREPFVAVCGADYPNLHTNSEPTAATCPECRKLACLAAPKAAEPIPEPTAIEVTLWDGEPRYVMAGGLLTRDPSKAQLWATEGGAELYAERHLDAKTVRRFVRAGHR